MSIARRSPGNVKWKESTIFGHCLPPSYSCPAPRNLLVTIFMAEWLSIFRCGAWLSFLAEVPCAYMLLLCVPPRSLTFFSCAYSPPPPSQRSILAAFSLGNLCWPHFVLCFPWTSQLLKGFTCTWSSEF